MHMDIIHLVDVQRHLRLKLIETIGYRRPTADEEKVFTAIDDAVTPEEACDAFADYLRTLG